MPTLLDILLECAEDMGEVAGTPMHRDPPPASAGGPSRPWERHLRDAMDEVCRRSWCFYTTVSYDLTAGQAQVVSGGCSGVLFEIEEARLSDANGGVTSLAIAAPRDFARYSSPGNDWRTDPPAVPYPRALIVAGLNNLRLYPAPNYSAGAALMLTGYATTNGVRSDGTPLVALSDPFPLPYRAIECVKLGAKWRRARQYPKEYGDLLPVLKADYFDALGDLNAEGRSQSRVNAAVGV